MKFDAYEYLDEYTCNYIILDEYVAVYALLD